MRPLSAHKYEAPPGSRQRTIILTARRRTKNCPLCRLAGRDRSSKSKAQQTVVVVVVKEEQALGFGRNPDLDT